MEFISTALSGDTFRSWSARCGCTHNLVLLTPQTDFDASASHSESRDAIRKVQLFQYYSNVGLSVVILVDAIVQHPY